MPCDPEKLRLLDTMIDAWLDQRKLYGDEDEDDITNPLDAPPSEPFYSDGPPEKIHGEGKQDQELWPPKPRVPVPIETL